MLLVLPTLGLIALGLYIGLVLMEDEPVVYADIEEHFKYGSTGGERESGFPLLDVPGAAAGVCAPPAGAGYASLGLIYEPGRDLPVGMSMRNHMGIDRTFLNCAVCHASTVRDTPAATPRIYPGHAREHASTSWGSRDLSSLAPEDAQFHGVHRSRERGGCCRARPGPRPHRPLRRLSGRGLAHARAPADAARPLRVRRGRQTDVGAGPRRHLQRRRRCCSTFRWTSSAAEELDGAGGLSVDLEPAAAQGHAAALGRQQHDGRGAQQERGVRHRHHAADASISQAIGRIENWLLDARAADAIRIPIDAMLARGARRSTRSTARHVTARTASDFSGDERRQGDADRRDRHRRRRLDSYTLRAGRESVDALRRLSAWRFQHFRKTFGYANMPLDGLWLRAPYLHNGSVPTLRDLLEPAAKRPATFYRGYDVYDPVNVGFVSNVAEDGGRKLFRYDTAVPGNSNAGHEGAALRHGAPAGGQGRAGRVSQDVLDGDRSWTLQRSKSAAGAGRRTC